MSDTPVKKPTTLREAMEAAAKAEAYFNTWPAWKRELPFYSIERAVPSAPNSQGMSQTRPKSR